MPKPLADVANSANVLVMMPSYLGDAINAIPALKLLQRRYPQKTLYVICRPSIAAIFEREATLCKVIVDARYSKPGANLWYFSRQLKQYQFELGILFRNSFSDALLFKLAGVAYSVGYKANGRRLLLDQPMKLNRNRHYIQRYAFLVDAYHQDQHKECPAAELHTQPSSLVNKDATELAIAVYIGGKNKKTRHYPHDLAATMLGLIARNRNLVFYLLGDSNEAQDNQSLVSLLDEEVKLKDLSAKTSVTELLDLIASVDLLITIDSGPLHMAAAVNTPYVAIVGLGTSPWSTVMPKQGRGQAIVANNFAIYDQDIIRSISPAQISDAVLQLLNQHIH